MKNKIKIKKSDWELFKSALIIYCLESFQSTNHQNKIKERLKEYRY